MAHVTNPAQRLWMLERSETRSGDDACRFLGAVTLLGEAATYVVLIRSANPHGTSEDTLRRSHVRFDIERDAVRFASLDEALSWADATKRAWMCRGWKEPADEGNDC